MSYIEPEKRYSFDLYEYARSFRSISLSVEKNPSAIFDNLDLPAIRFLINDDCSTTFERTKYLEVLSYGDPGVLLASPGPSLSGIAIRELGDNNQKNTFFDAINQNRLHTFFGLTENRKGSDAANIEAYIIRDKDSKSKVILSGMKCFCGNIGIGKMGVIFARYNSNISGISAFLITPDLFDSKAISQGSLSHSVLNGARLGFMKLNNLVLDESKHLLGKALPPLKRGVIAFSRVFNQYRTGVAAIALGQAQSVLDYLYENKRDVHQISNLKLNTLNKRLENARSFLQVCAMKIDQDKTNGEPASLAKINVIDVSSSVMSELFEVFPNDILFGSPWLLKSFRDRFCWEFMEGTSQVLLNHTKSKIRNLISGYQAISREKIYA